MSKKRPPGGRPPPRLGKGGIGPPGGRVPGRSPGKAKGGGAGKPPSSRGGGKQKAAKAKKKGACSMALPIAIPAVLFYALPRMAIDHLRKKKAR